MPKVNIEYDLPDEQDAFTLATKGHDFWSCLFNLDQSCRDCLKYGHSFKTPEDVLEWVRQQMPDLDCVS